MMFFKKKKLDEDSKLRYEQYLEDVKKWRQEDKRKEDEENAQQAGEKTVGEIKNLIRKIVRDEAWAGDLPFLNRARKRTFEKTLWIGALLLVAVGLIYWNFWRNTEYNLEIGREKLFVSKATDGTYRKHEIKVIDNKWHLCKENGEGCSVVFAPLEARYNDSYKFVFLGRGKAYWVTSDKTDPREVKLMDGSWVFRDIDSDEGWTSFEELMDAADYQRDDYRDF